MVIYLSVGHGTGRNGSYDPGAVSGGYHEFKLAKEIAKYCKEYLKQYDCTVYLVNYDGKMYLYDRIKDANRHKPDLAIEFHLNAGGGKGRGVECYYAHTSGYEKKMAQAICVEIAKAQGLVNRGAKTKTYEDRGKDEDYFGFVREVKGTSLLLENCFIDNKADRDKVATATGQKRQGEAVGAAIVKFYGLKKKSTPTKPTTPTKFDENDLVKIKTGAKYYNTDTKVPNWVLNNNWYITSITGNRVVLGKSESGKNNLNSPIAEKDLILVTEKPKTLHVGGMAKIKSGAKYGGLTNMKGKDVPSSYFGREYKIAQMKDWGEGMECRLEGVNSWYLCKYLTPTT